MCLPGASTALPVVVNQRLSFMQMDQQPLIIAAYLHGDSSRKRRVKVAPNLKWTEFIKLFYSRLDLNPNADIEIFDERGIEIVTTEDLVSNDVLVVREMRAPSARPQSHDMVRVSADQSLVVGPPSLSHFIQSNSFGYYFLAQVDNLPVSAQTCVRRTHCVLKIPLSQYRTG